MCIFTQAKRLKPLVAALKTWWDSKKMFGMLKCVGVPVNFPVKSWFAPAIFRKVRHLAVSLIA
jgi:hypothetical protein